MDLGLHDRRAVITGASKGIGLACAESLAREGVHVHLVARTEADLQAAVTQVDQCGPGQVSYQALNLADSQAAQTLIETQAQADILVNNAGAIPSGSLMDIDEATWREAWDLKVFGYINLCRGFYQHMRGRGGVIINVIGAGGERPTAGYAAGAGGNAALMALTRALGGTSRKDDIRVVGINPGQIITQRLQDLLQAAASKRFNDGERWQELLDPRYPPGEPAHIADMVAFLASDRSANTTGTIVTIDGGHCAR
jgi:NAD(P)-dependent dehydrogenase (short-subunit alcohol dehydrogenase family)